MTTGDLALLGGSWDSWWFPGFSEFLNMLAFAFWWELAFVIVGIPILLILLIVWAGAGH